MSHNDHLLVFYSCSNTLNEKWSFGLEIVLVDQYDSIKTQPIFSKIWKCLKGKTFAHGPNSPFRTAQNEMRQQKILVKFPAELRFKPDYLHKVYYVQNFVKIRLWMLDYSEYLTLNKQYSYYEKAKIKTEYSKMLKPPYSRESKLMFSSLNFPSSILYLRESKTIYTCDYDEGNYLVYIKQDLFSQ